MILTDKCVFCQGKIVSVHRTLAQCTFCIAFFNTSRIDYSIKDYSIHSSYFYARFDNKSYKFDINFIENTVSVSRYRNVISTFSYNNINPQNAQSKLETILTFL